MNRLLAWVVVVAATTVLVVAVSRLSTALGTAIGELDTVEEQ